MNKLEQLAKYDFHDSLLEDISYDEGSRKVSLTIDFCNWKQEWNNESNEETSILTLLFNNVYNIVLPKYKLNSDEIIEFEVSEDSGVKIVVFNDRDERFYKITFNAETVEIR